MWMLSVNARGWFPGFSPVSAPENVLKGYVEPVQIPGITGVTQFGLEPGSVGWIQTFLRPRSSDLLARSFAYTKASPFTIPALGTDEYTALLRGNGQFQSNYAFWGLGKLTGLRMAFNTGFDPRRGAEGLRIDGALNWLTNYTSQWGFSSRTGVFFTQQYNNPDIRVRAFSGFQGKDLRDAQGVGGVVWDPSVALTYLGAPLPEGTVSLYAGGAKARKGPLDWLAGLQLRWDENTFITLQLGAPAVGALRSGLDANLPSRPSSGDHLKLGPLNLWATVAWPF
jgi:hypothetical protein